MTQEGPPAANDIISEPRVSGRAVVLAAVFVAIAAGGIAVWLSRSSDSTANPPAATVLSTTEPSSTALPTTAPTSVAPAQTTSPQTTSPQTTSPQTASPQTSAAAATTAPPPATAPPTSPPVPADAESLVAAVGRPPAPETSRIELSHETESGVTVFSFVSPSGWLLGEDIAPDGRLTITLTQPESEFEEFQIFPKSIDIQLWDRHDFSTFEEQVATVFFGRFAESDVQAAVRIDGRSARIGQSHSENGVRRVLATVDGGAHVIVVDSHHQPEDQWLSDLTAALAGAIEVETP